MILAVLLLMAGTAFAVDAGYIDLPSQRAVVLLRVGESIPMDPGAVTEYQRAEVLEVYSGDLEPGRQVPVAVDSTLPSQTVVLATRRYDTVTDLLLPLFALDAPGEQDALCQAVWSLRGPHTSTAPPSCDALDPPLGEFSSDRPTIRRIEFEFKGEEYYRAAAESMGQLRTWEAAVRTNRRLAGERERAARWIAEKLASETSPKPDPEPTPPE